jgi:hypothetical protein
MFIALAVLILALGGAAAVRAQDVVTVTLNAQNDSGETGTATLTDLHNGKIQVQVTISNAPAGVTQPMHIHKGTCATLEAKPTFPLTSLVDGKSLTEIETTMAELQNGNYAINGHKSPEEASVYVFCGEIPAAAAVLPASGGDFTSSLFRVTLLGLAIFAAGFVVLRLAPRAR